MHSLKLKKENIKNYMHPEKKRKKEGKKRRKGLSRKTFVSKTVCWCNIAGTLNICLVLTYQNFVIV